jgi:hypothetical protein
LLPHRLLDLAANRAARTLPGHPLKMVSLH